MRLDPIRSSNLDKELEALYKAKQWPQLHHLLSSTSIELYSAEAFYYKAMLLARSSERASLKSAINCLLEAQKLKPEEHKYHSLISEIFLKDKQIKESVSHAMKAHELAPRDPFPLMMLGRSQVALGHYADARAYFERCLALIPPANSSLINNIKELVYQYDPIWWEVIKSGSIELHRLSTEHKDFLKLCLAEGEFQQHMNMFKTYSEQTIAADIKKNQVSPFESKKIDWVVIHQGEPKGLISFVDINSPNKRAEFIMGYPDKDFSAFDTVRSAFLALNFAFEKLKLERVYSYVYSNNPHGQKTTLKLGFAHEGTMRRHVRNPSTGEALDMHVNGLLKEEFYTSPKNHKLMSRWGIAKAD